MAKIDGGIASTLFRELGQLKGGLADTLSRVLHAATNTGTSIAQDVVDEVLSTLQERIGKVVDIIDQHSPNDVHPQQ